MPANGRRDLIRRLKVNVYPPSHFLGTPEEPGFETVLVYSNNCSRVVVNFRTECRATQWEIW